MPGHTTNLKVPVTGKLGSGWQLVFWLFLWGEGGVFYF